MFSANEVTLIGYPASREALPEIKSTFQTRGWNSEILLGSMLNAQTASNGELITTSCFERNGGLTLPPLIKHAIRLASQTTCIRGRCVRRLLWRHSLDDGVGTVVFREDFICHTTDVGL